METDSNLDLTGSNEELTISNEDFNTSQDTIFSQDESDPTCDTDLAVLISCYVSQLKTPTTQILSIINDSITGENSTSWIRMFLSLGGLQKLLAAFNGILASNEYTSFNKEALINVNLEILDALLAKECCIEYILNIWENDGQNQEKENVLVINLGSGPKTHNSKIEDEFCKLLIHENIRTNIYDILSALCILPLFGEVAHSFVVSVLECYKVKFDKKHKFEVISDDLIATKPPESNKQSQGDKKTLKIQLSQTTSDASSKSVEEKMEDQLSIMLLINGLLCGSTLAQPDDSKVSKIDIKTEMQAVGVFKIVNSVFADAGTSSVDLSGPLKTQINNFKLPEVSGSGGFGGSGGSTVFDFISEIYGFCEGSIYDEKVLCLVMTLKELFLSNLDDEGVQKIMKIINVR